MLKRVLLELRKSTINRAINR